MLKSKWIPSDTGFFLWSKASLGLNNKLQSLGVMEDRLPVRRTRPVTLLKGFTVTVESTDGP